MVLLLLEPQDGEPTTNRQGFKAPTLNACTEWVKGQTHASKQHAAVLLNFDLHGVAELERVVYAALRHQCPITLTGNCVGPGGEILAKVGESPQAWMLPTSDAFTKYHRAFVEAHIIAHNNRYRKLFGQLTPEEAIADYTPTLSDGRFEVAPHPFRMEFLRRFISKLADKMKDNVKLRTEEGEDSFKTTVHSAKRKQDPKAATSPAKRQTVRRKTAQSNWFLAINDDAGTRLTKMGVAELCGEPIVARNSKIPLGRVAMDNLWEKLADVDLSRAGHGLKWMHGAVSKNVNTDERLATFLEECWDDDPYGSTVTLTYCKTPFLDGF